MKKELPVFDIGHYWWLLKLGLHQTALIHLGNDNRYWHINEEKQK